MKTVFIRFKNTEQLKTCLDRNCSGSFQCIYLADCEKVTVESVSEMIGEKGGLYFCLPEVTRQKKVSSIENMISRIPPGAGLLIRNPDQLEMILETGFVGPLIADSSLYAYNSKSIQLYSELLPRMAFVASDELTDRELKQTGADVIYKVYGHQLLMVTNQCLKKNY